MDNASLVPGGCALDSDCETAWLLFDLVIPIVALVIAVGKFLYLTGIFLGVFSSQPAAVWAA